jgi:hypothetical protein
MNKIYYNYERDFIFEFLLFITIMNKIYYNYERDFIFEFLLFITIMNKICPHFFGNFIAKEMLHFHSFQQKRNARKPHGNAGKLFHRSIPPSRAAGESPRTPPAPPIRRELFLRAHANQPRAGQNHKNKG